MRLSRRGALAGSLLLAGLGAAVSARAQGAGIAAPIRLENGRVLMDVTLNGQGPFPFAVDTGAEASGLRLELAQRLGLQELRSVRLGGREFPFYGVDELLLGGAVRQADVGLFGLEGRNLGAEGLLAAGLITAVDSELLFEAGQWRVYPSGGLDRSGFQPLQGTIEPARVAGLSSRLFTTVGIDGRSERAVIDTGAPRPLILSRDRAERLGLWTDTTPFAPVPHSNIRGPSDEPSRLVRLARLSVGDQTYENMLVALNAGEVIGGETILGLPVVRTLDLSISRADDSIWVRRNGLGVNEPTYGFSGLWLDESDGRVEVGQVGTGSPAAAAGVQRGDVLVGVTTLRQGLDLIGGPAGRAVTLSLRRGRSTFDVSFTLAAYL